MAEKKKPDLKEAVKLKPPRIITFAFHSFSIVAKDDNKWQAQCCHCKSVIVESRGTTSGFVR